MRFILFPARRVIGIPGGSRIYRKTTGRIGVDIGGGCVTFVASGSGCHGFGPTSLPASRKQGRTRKSPCQGIFTPDKGSKARIF